MTGDISQPITVSDTISRKLVCYNDSEDVITINYLFKTTCLYLSALLGPGAMMPLMPLILHLVSRNGVTLILVDGLNPFETH